MNRSVWWVILVLVWVAIGAGVYYWWQQQGAAPPAPPPAAPVAEAPAPPPAPPAPAEPQIRHPVEEARPDAAAEPEPAPLPPLGESDKAVRDALAGLVGRKPLDAFLADTGLVHRFVATVDNLPRDKASASRWPVKRTAGQFTTATRADGVYLAPENDRRYEPLLRVMESADTGKLVALYVRFYPLFQRAYVELGHPKGYFNDRLIEVIDHLLATPERTAPIQLVPPDVKGPVKLERPWEMYRFADPDLEAHSAGQKILLRMGAGNAGRVKAKLRDVRRQLTQRGVS
jgi:hypothetical protein